MPRKPMPRVAFCFHDPEPSGASVWLREFMLHGFPRERGVAILPAPSPLARELEEAGYEIVILNLRMGAIGAAPAAQRPAMLWNRVDAVLAYRRVFRRRGIQVAYVNSSAQIAPMAAARSAAVKLLVHVHEGWTGGKTHLLKKYAVQTLPSVAVFAARVGLRIFGPPRRKAVWEVSPNGVDAKFATLRERRAELRSKLGFGKDEKIVLFLGILCARKGVPDLLDAWEKLRAEFPNARLVMAGVADATEPDPRIRNLSERTPPGCSYLGFRRDAPELMAAADLFVLPSYGEAMPISISEALMIGTPVVARDVGDVGWQLANERGFPFKERGAEAVYESIREALLDPAECARRAEAGREFARERLDRKTQYAQIRRLIRKAAR